MKKLAKPIAITAVVLATLIMGYFSVIKAQDPTSYANPCLRYDKAIAALESERNLTPSTAGKDAINTRIAEVTRQKSDDPKCAGGEPSATPTAEETPSMEPSAEPSATPTAEETPSADPSAEPSATPTAQEEYPHFFFFEEGKRKARDFGPGVTGNEQEVFDEFTRRMHLDPALLCANGSVILGNHPGDSLLDCTKILMNDTSARDSYEERVFSAVQTMSVADKAPGTVTSAYMVEVDGIPSTILIEDVNRPQTYRILRLGLDDGRTVELRLDCGFQWDFSPEKESKPQPIQGDFSPEKESKPQPNIPVAEDCLNGGIRDEDGRCEPKPTPSKAPSPKPTPSKAPSLEPKSTNPADYKHETGAPKATVTEPAKASPDPVVTQTTGGGGVVDTPTKTPESESGVTAPGADPAPTTTQAAPPPADGANTPKPGATTCVPAPGKDSC